MSQSVRRIHASARLKSIDRIIDNDSLAARCDDSRENEVKRRFKLKFIEQRGRRFISHVTVNVLHPFFFESSLFFCSLEIEYVLILEYSSISII